MSRKITLILVLIWSFIGLACVGFVLFFILGGTLPFVRWNLPQRISFSDFSSDWTLIEQSSDTFSKSDVKRINVDCTTADFTIGRAEGDEFSVIVKTTQSAADTAAQVELNNGTLSVIQPRQSVSLSFGGYAQKIEILVPSGWEKDVLISLTTGDIVFLDDFQFLSAKFSKTTGDFSAASISADTFSVTGTTGDVDIVSLSADQPVITATTGDITVDSLFGAGRLSVTTGDIRIGLERLSGSLSVSTTTGDITLTLSESVGAELEADTSVGDIRSDFALLYSDSGVVGDSASGKIGNSPRYPLSLRCTTGDIRVNAG